MGTDRLAPWKKKSGFKKGLKTDIVLGDRLANANVYSSTIQTEFTQKLPQDQNQIAAGRFSGFVVSDRGQKHIVFGDPCIGTEKTSVTGMMSTNVPESNPINLKPIKKDILKYHTKCHHSTSAAHIGTQTKKDLPIDDFHFKNFTTTTQLNFPPITDAPNRVLAKYTSVPLVLGNSESRLSYTTSHSDAFVAHHVSVVLPVKPKNPSKLHFAGTSMNSEDIEKCFTTSSGEAYQPHVIKRMERTNAAPAENEIFGQRDLNKPSTDISVSKQDFVKHKLERVPKKRSGVDCISLCIHPQPKEFGESISQEVYKKPNIISQLKAAGFRKDSIQEDIQQSHVPSGDCVHYSMSDNHSISKNSYIKYDVAKPKLIKPSTESKIFEQPDDFKLNSIEMKTTSEIDYAAIPQSLATMARGIPVTAYPTSNLKLNGKIESSTTHRLCFKPKERGEITTMIVRKPAESNRMFPLNDYGLKHYKSMTEKHYRDPRVVVK